MPEHSDKKKDDLSEKIISGVERLSTLFRARLWIDAKAEGLTPLQAQIIMLIDKQSGKRHSITTIAAEFSVTKATVSAVVKTLLSKNLIIKKEDKKDSRGFFVLLTPQGKKYSATMSNSHFFFYQFIENLPQTDIEHIWDALLKLLFHLQKSGIIPVRMCLICRHFQEPKGNAQAFCMLMRTPLSISSLRIDCPEHEIKKQTDTE